FYLLWQSFMIFIRQKFLNNIKILYSSTKRVIWRNQEATKLNLDRDGGIMSIDSLPKRSEIVPKTGTFSLKFSNLIQSVSDVQIVVITFMTCWKINIKRKSLITRK